MALILSMLLVIFVFGPMALFFALRWLARRWLRNRSAHPFAAKITGSGLVLYAVLTLALLGIPLTYELRPNSAFGVFFHEPGGVLIGLVVVVLVVGFVERYLRKIGRPAAITLSASNAVPSSLVLPPETSLLSLAGFVPPGFKCGVEVLNDDTTPMEFVVSMLSAHVGLSRREAIRAMLTIHEKGGALLSTTSGAAAILAAQAIASEASNSGYPLVCRAVHVD